MEWMTEKNNLCRTSTNRNVDLVQKLSLAAQRDLKSMQFEHSHPANVVLFCEKEEANGIYIVLDGEIKTSINSKDGKRLSLSIAKKGDVLGLTSALSGMPYDTTIETLYPSRVAHVGQREFQAFLQRHPEVYPVLIEEISKKFTQACDQLRTVGLSNSAPAKLAQLLLDWSDNNRTAEGVSRMRFSMTHEEIGEFIGASRETVTRTLSSFKHRRLVTFNGSMLTIPNRDALANYALG